MHDERPHLCWSAVQKGETAGNGMYVASVMSVLIGVEYNSWHKITLLNYVRHSAYVRHQHAYYLKKTLYLLTKIEVHHVNVIVNWGLSTIEKAIMYPFYVLNKYFSLIIF